MARHPRVNYPGAVHHVYGRGIEKRKIFLDDQDRNEFLRRTKSNFFRWRIRCFAWALMENHFHFLVQSDDGNLPDFMRCLLTGYSLYFNERHTRVGHLFQNRYKSKLITDDSYLREAVRYIHLNPLRSGFVCSMEDLRNYPWTGHRQILSSVNSGWMDIETLRGLFIEGEDGDWHSCYEEFVARGLSADCPEPGADKVEHGILSDGMDPPAPHPVSGEKPPKEFLLILERVSVRTGIPAAKLLAGGKKYREVNARRDLLNACKKEMNVSISKISRWIGISESCGSYLLRTEKSQKGSF